MDSVLIQDVEKWMADVSELVAFICDIGDIAQVQTGRKRLGEINLRAREVAADLERCPISYKLCELKSRLAEAREMLPEFEEKLGEFEYEPVSLYTSIESRLTDVDE